MYIQCSEDPEVWKLRYATGQQISVCYVDYIDFDSHVGFGSASFRDLWDDSELRNDMPVFWEHNLQSLRKINEVILGLGETTP